MKHRIKSILTGMLALSVTMLIAVNTNAAIIQFDLQGQAGSGLLPGNEIAPTTGGSGGEVGPGISFDDVTKILTINVGWGSAKGFSDLTGTATATHLHGAAAQNANAGVLLNLSSGLNTSATDGGIVFTSAALSAGNEASLLGGLTYINVHTASNPGGEIRGNLVAIPEPSTLVLLIGASGGLVLFRRKLRQ